MAKIYKLTKGGQTIYPATTTNAVVNPKTRNSLTAELSELGYKLIKLYAFSSSVSNLLEVGQIGYSTSSKILVKKKRKIEFQQFRSWMVLFMNITMNCIHGMVLI